MLLTERLIEILANDKVVLIVQESVKDALIKELAQALLAERKKND